MADGKNLSDGQFCALRSVLDHGPIAAVEIILPAAMDGSRRRKVQCAQIATATLENLERRQLVTVERADMGRPTNAVGGKGHRRNSLTISITEAGRHALNT